MTCEDGYPFQVRRRCFRELHEASESLERLLAALGWNACVHQRRVVTLPPTARSPCCPRPPLAASSGPSPCPYRLSVAVCWAEKTISLIRGGSIMCAAQQPCGVPFLTDGSTNILASYATSSTNPFRGGRSVGSGKNTTCSSSCSLLAII